MKKDLPMPVVIAVIVVVVVIVAGVYLLLGRNSGGPAPEIPALPMPTDGNYVPPAANTDGPTAAPTLPTPPPAGN
ncbi:MAG: hypothetical protein IK083_08165 [Abditibacteriota bacterium]|nr:hypothetical protein [Abditibacteriota bacterium]